MDDLRVLEQQQRESQRLLASIKLTKQHKLEQRNSLDEKLSSLKYANGERKAQLLRARDVLSKSTREIGTARLRSGKSGENLKLFDQKLKRAIETIRNLQEKRRIFETLMIELKNTTTVLSKKKSEAKDRMQSLEMRRDESKHKENLLINSIQCSKIKIKTVVEETSSLQAEISALEQDLASSQQMEASTKFRSEGIKNEIHEENERHEEKKISAEAKLKFLQTKKDSVYQKIDEINNLISSKKEDLIDAHKKLNEYEDIEGFERSLPPGDGVPPLALDVGKIRAKFHQEESKLQEVITLIKDKKNEIKDMHSHQIRLDTDREKTQMESENIRAFILKNKSLEHEKETYRTKVLSDLKNESKEKNDLILSLEQLEEKEREDKKCVEQEISQGNHFLINLQKQKLDLATQISSCRQKVGVMYELVQNTKKTYESAVLDAKSAADRSKVVFETMRKEAESYSFSCTNVDGIEEINTMLKDNEDVKKKLVEKTEDILKGKNFINGDFFFYI